MRVLGVEITDDQLAAARTAMIGVFRGSAVRRALLDAGVPSSVCLSKGFKPAEQWFVWEVANRALQHSRKAGLIKHLGGGNWEQVS